MPVFAAKAVFGSPIERHEKVRQNTRVTNTIHYSFIQRRRPILVSSFVRSFIALAYLSLKPIIINETTSTTTTTLSVVEKGEGITWPSTSCSTIDRNYQCGILGSERYGFIGYYTLVSFRLSVGTRANCTILLLVVNDKEQPEETSEFIRRSRPPWCSSKGCKAGSGSPPVSIRDISLFCVSLTSIACICVMTEN